MGFYDSMGKLHKHMKESIKPKCVAGECIEGTIAGNPVSQRDWEQALKVHDQKMDEFCTSRQALNHPGFVKVARYCINCGTKLR